MNTPKFYDLIKEVDQIVARRPDDERLARFSQLVEDETIRQYAFKRLDDPSWIEPLRTTGFFRSPPEPIRDQVKGTVSFPFWPESHFLARMAARTPEAVLEIALEIPFTENLIVHEDLTDAALAMPPPMAMRWAQVEARWLEGQETLSYLLPEKLGALVAKLAQGDEVEAALDLAWSLLTVLPDPRIAEWADEAEAYRLPRVPRARFDGWRYGQILEKHVPKLVGTAKERALTLLCDLLDSAIQFSLSREEDDQSEDHSYIWRPTIEIQGRDERTDIRNLLVSAVRDAVKQLVRADLSILPLIVQVLEGPLWSVFHRLALHILCVFPDAAPALVAERLTDRARFGEFGLRREYALLARDQFGRLLPEDQSKILGWIGAGPDLEEFKVRQEEWTGKRPTEEEAEKYGNIWRRDHLTPIRDALSLEWRKRYEEMVREPGEPERPGFEVYSTGSWVGRTSPRSAEDLRSMTVEEVVAFLRAWQPSGDPMSPSPEALGRVLAEVVAVSPERFAEAAGHFQGLDPTYVRALLSGLRDATNEKRPFPWSPVLNLCRWITEQPREIPGRRSEYADLDPGWGWTRKTIANLLSGGFSTGQSEMPFDLQRQAWEVLQSLTEDPEPTPEYETRYGGSNMDPATVSINTTRGEAMHAVIRYALWVRRHIESLPDGKQRVARGFDEMQEVREVLEAHLDPLLDPSLAIRAVYGQWFPWLVLLDSGWARSNVPKIFPAEERFSDLHNAAWETYIVFCDPYDNVFEVLRVEYDRAVERIGVIPSDRYHLADPDERLAEHLMTFYWRGKLSLDEPTGLLARFYEKASDGLRGHALDFVGRSLGRTERPLDATILLRLQELWEQRISEARAALKPASHSTEMSSFGTWFASDKFDDAWGLAQLTQALYLVEKMEVDRQTVERLAKLEPVRPRETVECLRLMIKVDKEGWGIYGWREAARTILATAIRGQDSVAHQAAVDLIHLLGARGHWEFRDLLPGESLNN